MMSGEQPGSAGPIQPLVTLSQFIEQLAPHNILARLQAQQAAPPAAEEAEPMWRRQKVNVGLYKQEQTVGMHAREGVTTEQGYMTGLGDIAVGYAPPPAKSFQAAPETAPTTVGLGDQAATNLKGIKVQETNPVTPPKKRFTLYAPLF
jgi:hypothetical protein